MSRCRSCGAEVVWALTTNGKRIPIDPVPMAEGNVRLRRAAGHVFADFVAPLSSDRLRFSHFATCKWRRVSRVRPLVEHRGEMSDPTQEDRYRAMGLVQKLSPNTHDLVTVVVEGDPPSKARPRFTKSGGVYTPKKTIEGELRYAHRMESLPTFLGNVAIGCVFYRSSYQRIDVDNLLKAVLDAATRARMWVDDSQVTGLTAIVEYDPENPRAVITFGHHTSSLRRGDDAKVPCEACGKLFLPAGNRRRELARWCSRECRTHLAEAVPCPQCNRPFKRRSGNQKYCSVACRAEASRAPRACEQCGARVSKTKYRLCRECFEENAEPSSIPGQLPLSA